MVICVIFCIFLVELQMDMPYCLHSNSGINCFTLYTSKVVIFLQPLRVIVLHFVAANILNRV